MNHHVISFRYLPTAWGNDVFSCLSHAFWRNVRLNVVIYISFYIVYNSMILCYSSTAICKWVCFSVIQIARVYDPMDNYQINVCLSPSLQKSIPYINLVSFVYVLLNVTKPFLNCGCCPSDHHFLHVFITVNVFL